MNSFSKSLWVFALLSLTFWLTAFAADWLHPRLPCLQAEREHWANTKSLYEFERVSSFFWSSLCAPDAAPILISASEGTGDLSFRTLAPTPTHEFRGAHRGLKTFAYMAAHDIHPERLVNLRAVVLINPVYFSFAARTDAGSIGLTSISSVSYMARITSVHWRWDEFFLSSLFIGARSYLDELRLFKNAKPLPVPALAVSLEAPRDEDYDFERNILKARAPHYTSFRSRFGKDVQPSRYLFDTVLRFAKAHPDAKVCYVMLPANLKNVQHFGRDSAQVAKDMAELASMLPSQARVDLSSLSEAPYVFQDPMHLTDFGKKRVMEEILKSPCADRVFER